MGKTKSGTTGLKVGLILIAILIIALAIMTYVLFCVELGNPYGDIVIKYNKLKTVMADDVFYLSQDFLIDNNLEIEPIYSNGYYDSNFDKNIYIYGEINLGDVVLEYDRNKIGSNVFMKEELKNVDFNTRVKNIDLYRYELLCDVDGEIPVRVSVVGAPGVNKKHKYDQSLGDVQYAILDKDLTTYYKGIGKSYEIKAQVGKSGLIKKYARLKITVSVDAEYVKEYTSEQIEERVDSLLNSSLNYVEFFK
ncbi:MAG: hypothetical protein K2O86_03910 [Clostridia bacterium]|nr:hypothetical protein [Clostridia bacterium]